VNELPRCSVPFGGCVRMVAATCRRTGKCFHDSYIESWTSPIEPLEWFDACLAMSVYREIDEENEALARLDDDGAPAW
jgi:hypothetical protein